MDELIKFVFAVTGTVIALLLSYIAAIVTKTSNAQQSHSQSIALVEQSLSAIKAMVDDLFAWRLKIQEDEINKYKEAIRQLKEHD